MWICPKCNHKFYNTNQSHSCGNFTIDDFLNDKTQNMIDLFNYFISEYKKIGEFDIHPLKTRVALLTMMRFCSINKIGADFINVHFVFTKPYTESQCFYKIDNLDNRFYVHHFKIQNKTDINKEVRAYMSRGMTSVTVIT